MTNNLIWLRLTRIFSFYNILLAFVFGGLVTPVFLLLYFSNKNLQIKNSSKSVEINSVSRPVVTDPKIYALISNKKANLNISDFSTKEKILKYYERTPVNYPVVVNNSGFGVSPKISVLIGDSISVINSSDSIIDIAGKDDWAMPNLEPNSVFIQEFYLLGEYAYTIYPFGIKFTVTVLEYTP